MADAVPKEVEALSDRQLRQFRSVFQSFDKGGSGSISRFDVGQGMRVLGLHPTDAELKKLVDDGGGAATGKVDFMQFAAIVARSLAALRNVPSLARAFAHFDPLAQGFVRFHGLPHTNDVREWKVGDPFTQLSMFAPLARVEGERIVESPVEQAELTRHYTEEAVAFIRANREKPFFLYLPHTMPHVPQYASPRFAGKSRGGLYGDTVEELDWSTGVILDTLRDLKLDARTLVIFTNDNGAPFRGGANATKKAGPAKENFPGRQLAGSNGPLRSGKGTTFEGGVRVPFIAWWPGRIAPRAAVTAPLSHLDLFPTLARLAGATLPAGVTLDGADVSSLLLEGASPPARAIYHYFGYQPQAVREGRWKLFLPTETRPEPRPVSLWWDHLPAAFNHQHRLLATAELYDLEADLDEKANVAAAHPEVVARLTRQARDFDAALHRDQRPMQFVAGQPPPAPGTVRTADTDLARYRPAP